MNTAVLKRTLPMLLMSLVLIQGMAQAMMIRVEPEQMAVESFDVVEGTVIARESSWNAAKTHITTRVTIEVRESWAGKSARGERVVLNVEGGTVGEIMHKVEHQPVFGANETVLVFLESRPDGTLRCLHATQGKYTLAGDYVVGFDLEPRSYEQFRAKLAPTVKQEVGER